MAACCDPTDARLEDILFDVVVDPFSPAIHGKPFVNHGKLLLVRQLGARFQEIELLLNGQTCVFQFGNPHFEAE